MKPELDFLVHMEKTLKQDPEMRRLVDHALACPSPHECGVPHCAVIQHYMMKCKDVQCRFCVGPRLFGIHRLWGYPTSFSEEQSQFLDKVNPALTSVKELGKKVMSVQEKLDSTVALPPKKRHAQTAIETEWKRVARELDVRLKDYCDYVGEEWTKLQ
jgi:hypothetical protein